MTNLIYFDNNATTKIAPEVLAKMHEVYALPLNPHSLHQLGRKASSFVEEARQNLKTLLNGDNFEVIFTGSATESSNTVINGVEAEVILVSKIEHAAVFDCRPANKKFIEINVLESGIVDINDLKEKLEKLETKNFLVSVMLANNETGAIQPISEIAKLVHQKGGLIHSDIVQAVGKIAVDLESLNIDFASVSAHKIHGPQGVGALLIRKGLDIKPLIFGGKQEKSKRAGTLNVSGIAGFGEACKLAKENLASYEEIRNLRHFIESSLEKLGGNNIKIFASSIERLPNTTYVAIKNADNQTQLINMDLNGICVSAGAACSSGSLEESRILQAMNVDSNFAKSAIRISLSPKNTKKEAEKFIQVWSEFYNKI